MSYIFPIEKSSIMDNASFCVQTLKQELRRMPNVTQAQNTKISGPETVAQFFRRVHLNCFSVNEFVVDPSANLLRGARDKNANFRVSNLIQNHWSSVVCPGNSIFRFYIVLLKNGIWCGKVSFLLFFASPWMLEWRVVVYVFCAKFLIFLWKWCKIFCCAILSGELS